MSFFDTDFHCHVLPGIDDGASDLDESVALIKMQMAQGVKNIVCTPHYRMHQMSVDTFLERRQKAYDAVISSGRIPNMPHMMLAAEIALEHNLYELDNIDKLGNPEMNTLLLELPYATFHKWMIEEIEEIAYRTQMQIIVAHLDRYVEIFSQKDYNEILNIPDAIFQFNITAFSERKGKKLLKQLIKDEYPILFGTDCHNTVNRKPNFDVMTKALKRYEPSILVERLLK